MYLDVHGLAFETSICYRQDQSGITISCLLFVLRCLLLYCYNCTMHRVNLLRLRLGLCFTHLGYSCYRIRSWWWCTRWYSDAMYPWFRLSHAKGANSLCMVLFSSLVRMFFSYPEYISTPQASRLFLLPNFSQTYRVNGPTPRDAYI